MATMSADWISAAWLSTKSRDSSLAAPARPARALSPSQTCKSCSQQPRAARGAPTPQDGSRPSDSTASRNTCHQAPGAGNACRTSTAQYPVDGAAGAVSATALPPPCPCVVTVAALTTSNTALTPHRSTSRCKPAPSSSWPTAPMNAVEPADTTTRPESQQRRTLPTISCKVGVRRRARRYHCCCTCSCCGVGGGSGL